MLLAEAVMPFKDPLRRKGRRSPFAWERLMYKRTKNPIYVWRALRMCSDLMRAGTYGCDSLPKWVLDYLDAAALTVEKTIDAARRSVPQTIAQGFGFKGAGRGVRDTAFSEYTRQRRDMRLS